MSITASPELISLCQSQLMQLKQVFGAISAVIYLAETSNQAEQPSFIPVVSYPDSFDAWSFQWQANQWQANQPPGTLSRALPTVADDQQARGSNPNSTHPKNEETEPDVLPQRVSVSRTQPNSISQEWDLTTDFGAEETADLGISTPEQQVVLPLLYSEVAVGLLVVMRHDRTWLEEENLYLQGVAKGIAAGFVLERRNQWLQQRLQTKRALQGRQSEVFHNLMHQFRNPLTALGTFGKLLLRRMSLGDSNRAVADNMLRESRRLQELINDFDETVELGDADLKADLEWMEGLMPTGPVLPELHRQAALTGSAESAEPEAMSLVNQTSGKPTTLQLPSKGLGRRLHLQPESLSALLSSLWVVTEARAAERNIHTWSQSPKVDTQIMADRAALQEVLANLLDNAVKYSSAGAWVWLLTGARRMQDGLAYQGILIGDTGAGIPLSDQPHLFQRYYRGEQAQGPIEGTGLGLAIASDLVKQMQGYIDVISPVRNTAWIPDHIHEQLTAADGDGTSFIVWLPEAKKPAPRPEACP